MLLGVEPLYGELGVPDENVRVLVGGQDHLGVEGHAANVEGVLERPAWGVGGGLLIMVNVIGKVSSSKADFMLFGSLDY